MAELQYHGQNKTYTIAGEIGKGGEGRVYEIANDYSLVLKLYTEPLSPAKIRKLKLMAERGSDTIKKYAAWPQDIVTDSRGMVCGFVMRKLTGYVPIHMLFSPMDRKKMFPDKGYNFLVRVAGNMARAFHACHSSELVMGDVNEGNILVNNMGMVAFIDCDSFQIKDGSEYYLCEVGVPRYTPPELLLKKSFENVVRTTNTDIFSMSILIFQLLFLGRHPFAGKNISKEEIDEEKAIRQKWFAYSLDNAHNKLSPPDNAFSIRNLSDDLSALFHSAFEHIDNRPLPAQWIKEIDAYEKELVPCTKSKVHIYPNKLSVCLWCEFKEKRNILFFLDDSYLLQDNSFMDIEKFINGFKIDTLDKNPIRFPQTSGKLIVPGPIDFRHFKIKKAMLLFGAGVILVSVLLAFASPVYFFPGFIFAAFLFGLDPMKFMINKELQKRESEYLIAKQKLEKAIAEYNIPSEYRNYKNAAGQIEELIVRYKNLPNELSKKRKTMEEKFYNEQLHQFLVAFDLTKHSIPSIGPTRQASLLAAGIRTASDISKLNKVKVQGIGPTYIQILLSWQRQVGSNFVYQPNNYLIGIETKQLSDEMQRIKRSLEHDIKAKYQSMQYIKMTIEQKRSIIQNQMEPLRIAYFQTKIDHEAYLTKSREIRTINIFKA